MNSASSLSAWEAFTISLRQAEYLHVLLHPLPVYGMAMGILALVLALALRSRPAAIVGLALVLLAALSVWPVRHYGEKAYDGVYGTVSLADRDGARWLEEHSHRADQVSWVFYAVAALAAAGLIAPRFYPKTGRWLTVMTLVGALVATGCGAWISKAGGRVKHKEFRLVPPPDRVSETK